MVALKQERVEPTRRVTAQEYLERERTAETKSEFHDGVVVAMAGASPEHNGIVFDIAVALGAQLRGGPCQGFANDLRVWIPDCNKYYYPDVVVACEEPHYQELAGVQSLLNPTLIVEVLSESTEATDRGEKWTCSQTLASLQTYVIVAQNRPLIEVYRRHEHGWFYTATIGIESVVSLDAVGCELRLADVYARVPVQTFPPQTAQPATEENSL